MYINSQSPVLGDMLDHESSKGIAYLEISDADMLKEYFAEKMTQSLLDKKRVLVVTPDRMDISVPSKILTKYNLAHYSAIYPGAGENGHITERLRTLADLKAIPLLRQEYNHIVLKYKELNHKIHDTLLSINRNSIKCPSFKEMLLSIKPRPKADIPESIVEKIAAININPTIIKRVRQLQQSFQKRFVYVEEAGYITAACIEDAEALKFARTEVAELRRSLNQCVINIERELYLMKRVIVYELEEELAQWLKIKESLQQAFLQNELDNYPTSFEDHGLPLLNKLRGFKYLKFSLNIVPEMGWGQVSNILGVITAIMESAPSSINLYFEEYVRKLSLFNTSNDLLDQYIVQAQNILKRTSNSKYIDYKCGHQFLQVDALLLTLKEALQKAMLCESTLTDESYIKFKIAINNLNINEDLLKGLYHLESEDWSEVIEFYGQRSHLISSYSSNMNQLRDWYESLKDTHRLLKHTVLKEIHNRWCAERIQILSYIRNNHWDIYKEIFEGTSGEHTLRELIDELGTSILGMLPVMVVNESNIKNLFKEKQLVFDEVFYLDPKDVRLSDIDSFKEHNLSISLVTTHSLDIADVLQQHDVVSSYCGDIRLTQRRSLQLLDKSERYRHAVALAGSLTSIISPANIYKKGDKVYISTLDQLLDQRFIEQAGLTTNNVLFQNTTELSHFVETLLHHDDITILIENNLLNDHNGVTSLWQQSVIDHIADAGIAIKNVYTHELYHDLNGAVAKLCRDILETSPVPSAREQPVSV